DERCADPTRAPADDLQRVAGRAGDSEIAPLDDRRLLAGDRADGAPEPVHVIEGDVRDRGDPAIPGVRRIEPPAQADPDDGDVDPLLGEPPEEHRGEELEL